MKNKLYRHIFFDLDRTLWDFDTNSRVTLEELYREVDLPSRGIADFSMFLDAYHTVNAGLWEQYRSGKLPQSVLRPMRFDLSFQQFGLYDPSLAAWFGEEYLSRSARGKDLFPGAIELLDKLYPKYRLHIITNGFADVQHAKLTQSGLARYFTTIVTSEEAGIHKPDPGIFHYALEKAKALASESLMVGDDLQIDIMGAMTVGMDQMWYNPAALESDVKPTYSVSSLQEIGDLL